MTNFKSFELKPFIKWVGGKRNVIKEHLAKYLPKTFNTYIEPFLGGGAMLCWIKPKKAVINDINNKLIATYFSIKDQLIELENKLIRHKNQHSQDYYYKIREKQYKTDLEIAAQFIYLNKTCYNGMYRVNSKGKFNVPWNKKTRQELNLFDSVNLANWHKYLNENQILICNESFELILDKVQENDFVYCDPPYDYEEGVIGFDKYNKEGFGQQNQVKLANKLKELHHKGVKWMLSNHNTKLIRNLYKEFKIKCIETNRFINCKSDKRKSTGKEVIIYNYDPKK